MNLSIEELESTYYLGHVSSTCPYLPDRESRLLFIDGSVSGLFYRMFLDRGYRRNGQVIYRTDCDGCNECRVIRTTVADFSESRSQRRVRKKGDALVRTEIGLPNYTDQKADLYRKYLQYQHRQNEEELTVESYEQFFVRSCPGVATEELRLFIDDRLIGLGIMDRVGDVLSSVYFYFDPDHAHLSPGVYSVLKEIDYARSLGLRYYYPGYYIHECSSMNYKSNYRPAWILRENEKLWVPIGEEYKGD